MKPWIYLFLASCCETLWFYCIQYMNSMSWAEIFDFSAFTGESGWKAILAVSGYGILGVFNVLLFSMALKKISAAPAFAVWTGLALLFTTLADGYVLNEEFTAEQGICMILIVIGIVGLRASARSPKKAP